MGGGVSSANATKVAMERRMIDAFAKIPNFRYFNDVFTCALSTYDKVDREELEKEVSDIWLRVCVSMATAEAKSKHEPDSEM